ESHDERHVRRPERDESGPEAVFGVRDLDLENQQRDRDREHAVAESLEASFAFSHGAESSPTGRFAETPTRLTDALRVHWIVDCHCRLRRRFGWSRRRL